MYFYWDIQSCNNVVDILKLIKWWKIDLRDTRRCRDVFPGEAIQALRHANIREFRVRNQRHSYHICYHMTLNISLRLA